MNLEIWQLVSGIITLLGLPTLIKVGWDAYQKRRSRELDIVEKREERQQTELSDIKVLLQSQIDELRLSNAKISEDARVRELQYQELINKLRNEVNELVELKNELLIQLADTKRALQIALKIIQELDPDHTEFISGLLNDEDN